MPFATAVARLGIVQRLLTMPLLAYSRIRVMFQNPALLTSFALFAATFSLAGSRVGSAQDPKPQEPEKNAITPREPRRSDVGELKQLAWLSGTWVLEGDGKKTEEHWRPLQGTTLLGSSHTYDDSRTYSFEHLRITAMRGTIAYVAMPGGGKSVVFPLAKLEPGVVVFENEKHDHPQRIRYEKTKAGVTATISLLDGSRAQSYVYKQQ